MDLLAPGRVADRPFPKLIYALSARAFTGALVLEQDGRRYALWWQDGLVVDAESAAPEDTLGRVLREGGLIDGVQLGESLRRLAEGPGRSHLEILVEMGALRGEVIAQAASLALSRRAARVFALPEAALRVEPQAHDRIDGGPLDVRPLLYRGLRQGYDARRLDRELAPLAGHAVKLGSNADETALEAFGFADEERYVLVYLQKGYWELADLVDACVSLPRPTVMAVVYALLATDYLDVQPAETVPRLRKRAREATQQMSRKELTTPPPGGFVKQTSVAAESPFGAPGAPAAPAAAAPQPPPARTPPTQPPKAAAAPAAPLATGGSPQVREQILKKFASIESGADHFAVLEVDRNVNKDQVKTAYFQLAKTYHPDRLAVIKLEDMRPQVERIFARLSDAFSVLGDDAKRKEYLGILAQGGEAAVKRREDDDAAKAMKILSAEENFRIGEMALRRSQFPQALEAFKKALDANPDEAEHHAAYAWTVWSCAPEKDKVVPDVKRGLNKAIELNNRCAPAYYYLGAVNNFLGDADRAFGLFQKALELRPGFIEAERELRVLNMRRGKGGGGDKKGPGLFNKLLKK